MYEYDSEFMNYTRSLATTSARAIVPILQSAFQPKSVLDFGCGSGAWLQVWKEHGAPEVLGVDGEYVGLQDLVIDPSEFRAHDLRSSIDLGRRFDLVESVEVAEHLPEERARGFVADLCRHGDAIFFSAAPPGQGGENHINERPYSYWRSFFQEFGYDVLDYVRPQLIGLREVAPWYRFNTFLYVKGERIDSLPDAVRQTRLPNDEPIRDISPLPYKVRKRIVRRLPVWAAQALANVAKRLPR